MLEEFNSLKVKEYSKEVLEQKLKKLEQKRTSLLYDRYGEPEPDALECLQQEDPELAEIYYEGYDQFFSDDYNEEKTQISVVELHIRRITLELERRKREDLEQEIKIESDLSVKNTESDFLNYESYATRIAKIIHEAKNGTHVGIMGVWGSGKTFLLNLITSKLESLEGNVIVNFNASVGETDSTIWYSLLSKVADVYSPKYKLFKKLHFIWKSISKKVSCLDYYCL